MKQKPQETSSLLGKANKTKIFHTLLGLTISFLIFVRGTIHCISPSSSSKPSNKLFD
jgi:hypothetical protein